MVTIYPTLREANVARQNLWDPNDQIDFYWRVNELAGEAGEVCNLLKKWDREKLGLPGSRTSINAITEELADIIICIDLIGYELDYDELGEDIYAETFPTEFLNRHGLRLMASVGRMCALAEDDYHSEPEFRSQMENVLITVCHIANAIKAPNLRTATARKFNKTSEAVGLPVLLEVD